MNYDHFAAAYVRGQIMKFGDTMSLDSITNRCITCPIDELTDDELVLLAEIGRNNDLKMYRFKEKESIPRVKKVIGFLKAFYPESLLDVGSGRGAFLFPFMRELPYVPVTSIDILPHRVDFLKTIGMGGIQTLTAIQEDICTWHIPSGSYDVVTMLEVLEHIPDAEKAAANAYRIAKRFLVVSVPSKPDNNPEHIHLFTKDKLTSMFNSVGAEKISFDGVNGHLIAIISKGAENE